MKYSRLTSLFCRTLDKYERGSLRRNFYSKLSPYKKNISQEKEKGFTVKAATYS